MPGGLLHSPASQVTELPRPARPSIHDANWVAGRPRSIRCDGIARSCRTTETPSIVDCPSELPNRQKMPAAARTADRTALNINIDILSVERRGHTYPAAV